MARYRNDLDDERDYPREERFRREASGSYEEPYNRRREFEDEQRRQESGRGRFGERADYQHDEPRYGQQYRERVDEGDRYRDQGRRSSLYDVRGDLSTRRSWDQHSSDRSRLRCRDIMTKDLAVA